MGGQRPRGALVDLGLRLRQTARTDTALPAPLTSLVGRENEAGHISTLIDAHRLVTVIGPGGVGKTRLALHVATLHADRFPAASASPTSRPLGRSWSATRWPARWVSRHNLDGRCVTSFVRRPAA